MLQYCRALAPFYAELWAARARLAIRKTNFYMHGKRAQFLDGIVNDVRRRFGPNVTIAFGAAGPFSRVRGCGVKGPIQAIKRKLAQHYPVLMANEYRTSKVRRNG